MRLLFVFILFIFLNELFSQISDGMVEGSINLSSNGVDINLDDEEKTIINDSLWQFTFLDHNYLTRQNFATSIWKNIKFPFDVNSIEKTNFKGIAWFKNTFTIDSDLVNKNINLLVEQTGASEIYIDEKLFIKIGEIAYLPQDEKLRDPTDVPINLKFNKSGKHTIVIRYSNFFGIKYLQHIDENYNWLKVNLEIETSYNKKIGFNSLKIISTILMGILIGSFLVLALINLIFYLFYKKDKGNYYFSIFSFFMMLMFFVPYLAKIFPNPKIYLITDHLEEFATVVSTIYLMKLIFLFTYSKTPKRFYVYLVSSIIALIVLIIDFNLGNQISFIVYLIIYTDLIINSIIFFLKKYDPTKRKRKLTLWIICALLVVAFILFFILPSVAILIISLIVLAFILPIAGFTFVVPLYMIIKQAKSFAALNKDLELKLIEVQDLSEKTIAQEIEKQQILENQNKLLEEQVNQRTKELSHKNQEITDSIQYASRIQNALLVNLDEIEKEIANQFILFKPKDIVSGDFYFYAKQDQYIFLAAADCTGHGVPGSLMSMIGHEKLKLAIAHSINPGDILNYLNNSIKDALKQNTVTDATRDGMDIAFVRIDFSKNEVVYAGANRPIWIIRKNKLEIEEIKATKKAIGGFTDTNQSFEEHIIKLDKEDSFYLFSDGYADQFGKSGKKLMTKKFKELLLTVNPLSMKEQMNFLDEFIENWRCDIEQIDDILVIGVKL